MAKISQQKTPLRKEDNEKIERKYRPDSVLQSLLIDFERCLFDEIHESVLSKIQ